MIDALLKLVQTVVGKAQEEKEFRRYEKDAHRYLMHKMEELHGSKGEGPGADPNVLWDRIRETGMSSEGIDSFFDASERRRNDAKERPSQHHPVLDTLEKLLHQQLDTRGYNWLARDFIAGVDDEDVREQDRRSQVAKLKERGHREPFQTRLMAAGGEGRDRIDAITYAIDAAQRQGNKEDEVAFRKALAQAIEMEDTEDEKTITKLAQALANISGVKVKIQRE